MTTSEEYILSLKLDKESSPIVINVPRVFSSLKEWLLDMSNRWKSIQIEDSMMNLAQRTLLSGIMIGILQCAHRAGDVGVIDQLKEDEETKFLFTNIEDATPVTAKIDYEREKSPFETYFK